MTKKIITAVILVSVIVFFIKHRLDEIPVQSKKPEVSSDSAKKNILSYSPLTVDTLKGASGTMYAFIYKNIAKIDYEISRPPVKDTSVYLCIAGAFTQLDNYEIDGLYICKGKTGNRNNVNKTLGGGIKIIDGECEIFPTKSGTLLSDSLISIIENKKGSFFQQIQCITSCEAAHFKDVKLFQRRGIVVLKNGKTAIVESHKIITLKTFSDDLAALGVKDLLYTDMGYWDEGWYRIDGKTITIGNYLSQTDKQSNWVVFRK